MEQIRYRGRIVVRMRPKHQRAEGPIAFNFARSSLRATLDRRPSVGRDDDVTCRSPRIIARRASASPISTKAEVTSGPPTRMRVGVFILFHS